MSQYTPAHLVNKIIVLATGIPGSEQLRDDVLSMYESRGDWQEVAYVLETYLNNLLAERSDGIPGMLQYLTKNGFGLDISLTDAQALTNEFAAMGIETWTGLFEWLHVNLNENLATIWDNRADSANTFTDLLSSLDKNTDYNGVQAINAAREWLDGIGASAESVAAANEAAEKLIERFLDGKVKGTAIDGYVAGATVFIDVNGNGEHDDGEPVTETDDNGDFTFAEDELPAGILIGRGGVDLATGQPFNGEMTAPSGASVLSPLTTLVQQMMASEPGRTQADIEDALFRALDIPRVDLSSFDPIQAGLDTTSTREQQVVAAKIQSVTSQLVNVINVSQAVTGKMSPDAAAGAAKGAISAIAETIRQAADNGQIVRLNDTTTLTDVVRKSAERSGAVNEQSSTADRQRLDDLSSKGAAAVRDVNNKTQESVTALDGNPALRTVDAMSDIFKLQTLTQTSVAPALRDTNDNDLDSVVNRFTGDNLTQEVGDVQAGRLTADIETNQGNVTRPVANPTTPVPTVSLAADTGEFGDNITNNGELVIGNLVNPANWQYSLDNGTTWLNGSGDRLTPAGDGQFTVLVRQSDPAIGDVAQTSITYTVDTQAPSALSIAMATDTGRSATDNVSRQGTLNVSGQETGGLWQFSTDGGESWTNGTGTSFTINNDGSYNTQVRQIDIAGNISPVTSLLVTIDNTVTTPAVRLQNDTGSSGSDRLTADSTLTFSNIESGASWQYQTHYGSGATITESLWQSGSDSTFTLAGSDGLYTVFVRQTDLAGNTSQTASLNFTLDTMAPEGLNTNLATDSGNSASDYLTNDRTVEISGLESAASWQYQIQSGYGSSSASIWQDGSGSSFEVSGSDGLYTVFVRQTDAAGNSSALRSMTFTLDTTAAAPSIELADDTGSSSTDLLTQSGTVNVSALESGATWEYSADGGSTWISGSGTSFDATAGEGNGDPYTVLVRQTDVAGNTSDAATFSFNFDNTAPASLSVEPATPVSYASQMLTGDRTINVDLSALESGATWEYRYERKEIGIKAIEEPVWSAGEGSGSTGSFELPDVDGEYTLYVRQIDAAGNVSVTDSYTVRLDTTGPDDTSLEIRHDTGVSDDLITSNGIINVNGWEAGGSWQYQVLAGEQVAPDVSLWSSSFDSGIAYSSFNVEDVVGNSDGLYTVFVRESDVVGNPGDPVSLTFTLDRNAAAPTPQLADDTGSSASDLITNNRTVNVTNGLESGASWEYQIHYGSVATIQESAWSDGIDSDFDVNGSDGLYTVFVRQTDVAGNTSKAGSLTFTLDTMAPEGLFASLVTDTGSNKFDRITNDGRVQIDLSDLESDGRWVYSFDGGQTEIDGTSDGLIPVNDDGDYHLTVVQYDAAGNPSAVRSLSFTVDTEAPAAPSISLQDDTGSSSTDLLTNDGTVDVSALESGATWEYSIDGGSTWDPGSGSSFDVTNAEGATTEETVYVRQTDAAGNTSEVATLSFTLDNTPPTSLSVQPATPVYYASQLLTGDRTFTVDLTHLESGATWEYQYGPSSGWHETESAWTEGEGTGTSGSFELSGSDGSYTVAVRQIDAAGNTSSVSTQNVILDTTAEAVSLSLSIDSGLSNSDLISSSGTIVVDGLETGATWWYRIDNGENWKQGSGSSFDVSDAGGFNGDGEYTVLVRQTDVAGNSNFAGTYGSLTFTLDTTAPVAPSTALTSDSLTVNVSGLESNAKWQYNFDGSSAWTDGSGSSFSVDDAGSATTLYVRQVDVAGNVSVPQTLELPSRGQTILISDPYGNYSGGSGDDIFDASHWLLWMEIPFTVNGGAGNDTLKLRFFDIEATFDSWVDRVSNIEKIDISSSDHVMYYDISPQTVISYTDSRNELEIVFRDSNERDRAQDYILSDSGWNSEPITTVGVAKLIAREGDVDVTLTLSYLDNLG